jgi:hypothetical protein
MIGLYPEPATGQEEISGEESFAKTLLDRLELEEEAPAQSGKAKKLVETVCTVIDTVK